MVGLLNFWSCFCTNQWLGLVTSGPSGQEASFSAFPCWHLVCLLDGYSDRCEMIALCGLDLHFRDDEWHGAPFQVPVGYLYVFEKMPIQVLSSLFRVYLLFWFLFFGYWVMWVLYILWILALYQIYDFKSSLPLVSSPFHFVFHVVCCAEALYFDAVLFLHLLPLCLVSNTWLHIHLLGFYDFRYHLGSIQWEVCSGFEATLHFSIFHCAHFTLCSIVDISSVLVRR